MFHLGSSEAHIEAAVLHAIARNEQEASAQSSITEHLRTCRHCQSKLDWIASGLTLVEADSVPNLEALAWQRIETRLRQGIQDAQTVDQRSGAWDWRQLWVQHSPAVVFGVLLLFAVGLGTQRRFASGARFSQTAVVGQSPLAQTNPGHNRSLLAQTDPSSPAKNWVSRSGRQFQLNGFGLESLRDEAGHFPVFQLQAGHLVVRERLEADGSSQPLGLHAPGFRATARSSEFAVRYWADIIELEVGEGELAVLSPKNQSGPIRKGERKRVRLKAVAVIEPKSGENRPLSARPLVSGATERVIQALGEVDFEQSVDVTPPKTDEISRLWRIAQRQYYAESAIPLAKATVLSLLDLAALDRPERGPALRLLCEAAITMADHDEAIQRCETALAEANVGEIRRSLHRRLGRLYESGGRNCQRAVEHYSKALIFGAASLLDESTILGRARCALQLGDLTLATADLQRLHQRESELVRGNEFRVLLQTLKDRQNKKVRE